MATATHRQTIGPADHGRRMTLDEFVEAETTGGWLYELARGVVDVTEVPRPEHGMIVRRLARLFDRFDAENPNVVKYLAGGGECRLRLPGMQSDRHPDQAVYLTPPPKGEKVWTRWVPDIVVEVVSEGGEARDYVEKREEYLRVGIREYWIIDPALRHMRVLRRLGDLWDERIFPEDATYRPHLLPGLEARVGELLGEPFEDEDDED